MIEYDVAFRLRQKPRSDDEFEPYVEVSYGYIGEFELVYLLELNCWCKKANCDYFVKYFSKKDRVGLYLASGRIWGTAVPQVGGPRESEFSGRAF